MTGKKYGIIKVAVFTVTIAYTVMLIVVTMLYLQSNDGPHLIAFLTLTMCGVLFALGYLMILKRKANKNYTVCTTRPPNED